MGGEEITGIGESLASVVWLVKFAWIRACVKARPLDHPDKNANQKRIGQYGNRVLNVCQRVFNMTGVSYRP